MNKYTLETILSWEKMRHENVTCDYDKLIAEARRTAIMPHKLESWEKKGIHPKDNRVFWNQLFFWNCGNFEFSHFYVSALDGKMKKFKAKTVLGELVSGAYAFMSCFYREFGENPILTSKMRLHLGSLKRIKNFFRGKSHIPMVGERRELLIEVCEVLENYFDGDPRNIWEEGNFRAYGTETNLGIVDILTAFFPKTYGADVAAHESGIYYFNKRAHLAVMMYQGRAEKYPKELPLIEDIAELGPVPDYELPRSYEWDKIFNYSEELKEMIVSVTPIKRQGQMDLEIRGATTKAQVIELEEKNKLRQKAGLSPLHMGHVDYARWEAGLKTPKRHHVCLTVDY